MALPVAYTETTLGQYMHTELGAIAGVLGYVNPVADAGNYAEAVNDVLAELKITNLSEVTDIRKLRVLAKLYAWKMAAKGLSSKYDFSSDGESYHRSQMHKQALESIEMIMDECLSLGLLGYSASFQDVEYLNDPYGYPKDLEV
jgi:hypothetical protein